MTLTVYEYFREDPETRQSIEPPDVRTADVAFGAAWTAMSQRTRIVRVVATLACYLRISAAGTAATNDDQYLGAGDVAMFRVTRPDDESRDMPQLYALAA